ncbi:efflux RND transporter periplasmic adaptor subunit [Desulfotomaculum copahuensis]|uniref:RND efflux pump membrane fusion protein barrel-sandwich domain-containing protein n=1 Tax=Desulfotomaculum copahuensis TaxID=1838280 RepID=A0A1B7LGJ6_9FIRM|nr:HlyD family efflux transporter periplasmic adaptor subunit [Desulfotomaculum copahuensis]OAT85225.1 hypothetical protein A6M21_06680 [Desulfotomaculum copahuensis]
MSERKLIPVEIRQFITGHKIWTVLILVVVAGGLIAWHYLGKPKDGGGYLTQKVAYGDISETVNASGTIEPVQQVTLTFKNQGYVQNSYVQVGDRVDKGKLLAEERDSDFQAQLAQAEGNLQNARADYDKLVATQPEKIAQAKAQLAQAQSSLNLAKATLDRDQSLFEAGAITRADLDSAQNSYQSALSQEQSSASNLSLVSNSGDIAAAAAQVETAQAQVALAQNNLTSARIIAPFDGYVAQINGNVGQWTQGGAPPVGTAVSSQYGIILSSTALQLSAEINEADISKVKTGQRVTFTVDTYPGKTFNGKITSLAPMATSVNNVQMYEAIISIDDYSQLKAGLPASVNIVTAFAMHVPVVPQTALDFARTYLAAPRQQNARTNGQPGGSGQSFRPNGQAGGSGQNTRWSGQPGGSAFQNKSLVLVLENGKAVPRPVETGLSDDVNVEIKSGLQPGETIITGQAGTGGTGRTGMPAGGAPGPAAGARGNNNQNGAGPRPGGGVMFLTRPGR